MCCKIGLKLSIHYESENDFNFMERGWFQWTYKHSKYLFTGTQMILE